MGRRWSSTPSRQAPPPPTLKKSCIGKTILGRPRREAVRLAELQGREQEVAGELRELANLCFVAAAGWQGGMVAGRQDGKVAGWQDGRMTGWLDGRVAGWKDGRMEGWQCGRMARWQDGRAAVW
jgi:hypothetical protein